MANEIDLVVGEVAFQKITELINRLKDVDKEFETLATKFSNLGKASNPQSTAELAKLTAENQKLNKALNDLKASYTTIDTELAKNTKLITDNTLATKAQTAAETLKLKATEDQNSAYVKAAGAYANLDAQHKLAVKTAQDLAASTGRSTAEYEKAKVKANELGKQLRVIDTDIGKHSRNVGNYASSWNGLGNSINQLTREAPAFANSVQTGFMALSNNIPILTDELGVLIQKNKDLQAEGKPTQSILKTLAGAFFSWQTAISLGVTILTVYGAKLVDMARGLADVEAAEKSIIKIQKENDNAIKETTRNILHQSEVRKNKLREQGADNKRLFEEDKKTQNDLLKNLEIVRDKSVAKFNNIVEYRTKNFNNVKTTVDAELEIEGRKDKSSEKYARLTALRAKELKKIGSEAVDSNAKLLLLDAKNRERAVQEQKQKIDEMQFFEKDVSKNKRERFINDYKDEESLHNLRIAILEKEKQEILNLLSLNKSSNKERYDLRVDLINKEKEILQEQYKAENSAISEKGKDDKTKNDLDKKNKEISYKEHQDRIKNIDNRVKNELLTSKANFDKKLSELDTKSDLDYEDLTDKRKELNTKLKISELDENITTNKLISDDAVKNENITLKERQKAFEKYIELTKQSLKLEKELELYKATDPKEKELIEQKYKAIEKALENVKSPVDNLKISMEQLSKSFIDTFSNKLGLTETFKLFTGKDSLFERMSQGMAFTKDTWKADSIAVAEASQEMFNKIAQYSIANYEGEYKRLDAQKEASLKFTGDSVIAKEKIEADYAKKKKEIEKRQFEDEKKISMVNIVIDTAQAVVATLAKGAGFFSSPLAMIVAAMGAAQLGLVAAQQFPAYAEGTDNHRGGMMLVNDGAGSNFQEKVILPSGKVIRPQGRNVLMNAPKGTKVLNHEQQLFEMLQSNNISMSSQQASGLTYDEMNEIFQKNLGNIKTQNTIFDKNGFQSYVKNGNSITRSNSNRSQAIGISV